MSFVSSPSSEDLASFLQGLPAGAHVAVNLRGLDMETAVLISRRIADARKERLIVIGHPANGEEPVATVLGRALPLTDFATARKAAWVVVEAAASVKAGGAEEHARAEQQLGVELEEKLTVVCFYTEDAIQQVSPRTIQTVHSVVATPGQV
ncbi:MAG TPA: hypothetical protein VM327_00365 [Candidatus Thermoplasmatota archaeon]|nr:hypothetical protein [Candidatus Thermoplasmatota archaeon]